MEKKYLTKIAWVGKEQKPYAIEDLWGNTTIENAFIEKGVKSDWGGNNWPPVRVIITVEEV